MSKELLAKYQIDSSSFKSLDKLIQILELCEKKQLKIQNPAITRTKSGNAFIQYTCNCGADARSAFSNFLNKTVFACKNCSAIELNKIYKPLKTDIIAKKINDAGFTIISHNHNNCLKDSQWTLKCTFGHEFLTSGNHIQKIKNCPQCYKSSVQEEYTRKLIEHHFQAEFPNVRPDWLINSITEHSLELDMFNEKLALAFEYHGPQHFLPIFGQERLEKSLRNDSERRKSCIDNGIKLIEIPHVKSNKNSTEDLLNHVVEFLKNYQIYISQKSIDFALGVEIHVNKTGQVIEGIKQRLTEKNKTFISCEYSNTLSLVKYSCNLCQCEHEMKITRLYTASQNCPSCSHQKKKDNATIRHTKIAQEYCKNNTSKFIKLQYNKYNHVSGFFYSQNNQEFLLGCKRYKRIIREAKLEN